MVATMEQELKASRNVIGMLERFKGNAGPALTGELDILLADMRSSNYEAALTRFEARLNSPMLSDVVRGLIGVLRGDDSTVYFQMLAHDFKQIELQRLKAQAQKIPPKIRVFSLLIWRLSAMWHWRALEECFRQEGGEDEESSFMESVVRKTGRRICGCDRVGFVCGHGACPCHACASGFYSETAAGYLRYRTGA